MYKKSFLYAAKQLFLLPLFFAIVYAIVFYVRKETSLQAFDTLVNEVPSLVRFGSSGISVVTEYFPKFGALAGLVFALLQVIAALLLYFVMKVVRLSKWRLAVPLVLLLTLLPLAFLGHNMVYVSNRFTALSSGIILFVGYPLWYTSFIFVGLLLLICLYGLFRKVKGEKALMVGLMVGTSMMLSGCDLLGWLFVRSCDYSGDDVHCYQEVAVNSGNADECDKVPQKEGYTMSNPPEDKCHLMIAENTGDPTACNDVKGGPGSYTKAECLENVFASGIPEDCKGRPNEQECLDMYAEHNGVHQEEDQDQEGDQDRGDEADENDDEEDQGDERDEENEEDMPECESDEDCAYGYECKAEVCVVEPECDTKDFYCLSTSTLQICTDDQKVDYEDCAYGCENARCLTKEEKDEKDKKNEQEEVCKEGATQCLSDITAERCIDGEKVTEKCAYGCEKGVCRLTKKPNCTGWQRLNPFCSEDNDDIEDKTETDVTTMRDAATGQYMEMLQNAIDNESDPSKRRGLEAYQQFLTQAGEKMDEAQTTLEDLKNIKRIFLDAYDPSMDIENMDVDKILKPGIFDRMSTAIFGGPTTPAGIEMAEAEDGLAVYEQMLSRQSEIDFLKQDRMDRLGQVVTDKVKGEMTDKLKEQAEDIAGAIAGDAMMAVGVVDYALTSFQDEAKKQSFVGLARAYNRRRAALQEENPDMSEAELHQLAVQQVKEDPYRDAKGNTFIKYGNILENKDCKEGTGNQLCIDNHTFWTAMDKTYQHTHQKELHDREMERINRDFEENGY